MHRVSVLLARFSSDYIQANDEGMSIVAIHHDATFSALPFLAHVICSATDEYSAADWRLSLRACLLLEIYGALSALRG